MTPFYRLDIAAAIGGTLSQLQPSSAVPLSPVQKHSQGKHCTIAPVTRKLSETISEQNEFKILT